MYKAIVFDVDGTVVDTRFILDACRDAYFDVRGEKLSLADYAKLADALDAKLAEQ